MQDDISIDKQTFDTIRESQPFFIYKRVELTAPINYFLFTIEYGYWYFLRKIFSKYPEVDTAGAVFGPHLKVEAYQRGGNIWPQNNPVPLELFTTPGSAGVTMLATGEMTATGPKAAKFQNVVYPYRDNIELQISGQNLTTPVQCDIMLQGYLIPVKSFAMWERMKYGRNR